MWYGLALGAVVGDKDSHDSAVGGGGNTAGKEKSYNGMLSVAGHEVWGYLGGIAGGGQTVGPYGTAGIMVGRDMDVGVGGGIHFGKRFCLGIIIPIRATLAAAAANPKTAYLLDQASYHAGNAMHMLGAAAGGLADRIIQEPAAPVLAATAIGVVATTKKIDLTAMVRGAKDMYYRTTNAALIAMSGQ